MPSSTPPAPPVPVIDISPFVNPSSHSDAERAKVAQAWDATFRLSGFAIIVGHGVPGSTFETLDKESRSFFEQPLEDKMIHCHGAYGNDAGGYTPPGIEAVGRSLDDSAAKPDPVENFAFRGPPETYKGKDGKPSAPFASAASYAKTMEKLLSLLHEITAVSLGLPKKDFFKPFFEGNGRNGNALRIAYYPSPKELKGRDDLAATRYGAVSFNLESSTITLLRSCNLFFLCLDILQHTDYQTFTILRPDQNDWTGSRGGLEVFFEPTQQWVPVVLPRQGNPLVVNAGDLWEVWTDDRWHSGLHRVSSAGQKLSGVASSSNELGQVPERLSLVYFTGPLDEKLIVPLEGVGKGKRKGQAITAGEHLRRKLGITNVPEQKVEARL